MITFRIESDRFTVMAKAAGRPPCVGAQPTIGLQSYQRPSKCKTFDLNSIEENQWKNLREHLVQSKTNISLKHR